MALGYVGAYATIKHTETRFQTGFTSKQWAYFNNGLAEVFLPDPPRPSYKDVIAVANSRVVKIDQLRPRKVAAINATNRECVAILIVAITLHSHTRHVITKVLDADEAIGDIYPGVNICSRDVSKTERVYYRPTPAPVVEYVDQVSMHYADSKPYTVTLLG